MEPKQEQLLQGQQVSVCEDRELYVMRTKSGRVHLIEVVPSVERTGTYQIYLNGVASGGGTFYSDSALEHRLAFFERMSKDWREVQPEEAVLISRDLLCP